MLTHPANTTVVLLAAGHGKRMLPLTQDTPKPLLKVGKHTLIEHHLYRLSSLGFRHVVINIAYLAQEFPNTLGDGRRYGLNIDYSDESQSGALETAGGLKKALPLIKSDLFITINADIWTDFDFTQLLNETPDYATLVMVENPAHNRDGDFTLNDHGALEYPDKATNNTLTYSGIALYQRTLIEQLDEGKHALAPIFRQLIQQQKLQGIKLTGVWHDIGTPERLQEIRKQVS